MMLLDCQTCPVRDINCADCVVTALTLIPRPLAASPPEHLPLEQPRELTLDRVERRAVAALVSAGLVDREVASTARAVSEAIPYVTTFIADRRHAN